MLQYMILTPSQCICQTAYPNFYPHFGHDAPWMGVTLALLLACSQLHSYSVAVLPISAHQGKDQKPTAGSWAYICSSSVHKPHTHQCTKLGWPGVRQGILPHSQSHVASILIGLCHSTSFSVCALLVLQWSLIYWQPTSKQYPICPMPGS